MCMHLCNIIENILWHVHATEECIRVHINFFMKWYHSAFQRAWKLQSCLFWIPTKFLEGVKLFSNCLCFVVNRKVCYLLKHVEVLWERVNLLNIVPWRILTSVSTRQSWPTRNLEREPGNEVEPSRSKAGAVHYFFLRGVGIRNF